jgi:hypothetical protein
LYGLDVDMRLSYVPGLSYSIDFNTILL